MKYGRLKIFGKVFILTISMLCIMVVLAYLLIYILMPGYYKSYKIEQFKDITGELALELCKLDDYAKETELLSEFSQKNGINIELMNEAGEKIYDFYQGNYMITDWEQEETENDSASISVEMSGVGSNVADNIVIEKKYELKDGTKRNLTVMVPLQPLNEAKKVIIRIYPAACLICIIFALLFAFIFSRLYAKPIRRISELAKRMSDLEPEIEIPVYSSDEIGELSSDINHMYSELKQTIDELNIKIDKYSDSENQKIGFLRTVSHELKTPLAAANALIEGLIYEIPPYNENKEKYLIECKEFLEKAVELIKESLSLSQSEYSEKESDCNLKDIVLDVVSDYKMILRSKRIMYQEDIPENVVFVTRKNVFRKAVSNIVSNAVNYTPENGNIKIYYCADDNKFVIENTCTPLSKGELECIFKPFYSGNNDNKMSNGLGLSIVSQLFAMLHVGYKFVPNADGDGMKFVIDVGS